MPDVFNVSIDAPLFPFELMSEGVLDQFTPRVYPALAVTKRGEYLDSVGVASPAGPLLHLIVPAVYGEQSLIEAQRFCLRYVFCSGTISSLLSPGQRALSG